MGATAGLSSSVRVHFPETTLLDKPAVAPLDGLQPFQNTFLEFDETLSINARGTAGKTEIE